ncbi:MAG: phosphatidate cytidylyltransferase [Christensenellales bacterium]
MKKRILVALIMLVALGGAFALRLVNTYGVYFFDFFIGFLAIFCAYEFSKLLSQNKTPASPVASALFPSLMFAGHSFFFVFNLEFYYYAIIQGSILAFSFLLTFIVYTCLNTQEIQLYRKNNNLNRFKFGILVASKTFLTFLYPSFFLLALMLLNRIDALGIANVEMFGGNLGWIVLIIAFIIPIITDTFAMLGGITFKGPKLCKKISPNKTISGAVTALVLTSGIMIAMYYVFSAFQEINLAFQSLNIQVWHFAILGFFGAIVCQAGDIFESFIKRKAGVKDSGNIFPGHGGFLDRLDSHIFNAPYVLIFFTLLLLI